MELTTVEKTENLIKYLKRTKKSRLIDVRADRECDHWNFYYSVNGFFNNSYFALQISHHKKHDYEEVEINTTTDNIVEINNLLAKYGLKEKI